LLSKRKLPRLPGYDYSAENYYFVTVCTQQKRCLFGDGTALSPLGKLAESELLHISERIPGVRIDKYVVMPNHIHAIVVLGCDGAERSRPLPTLSTVVGLYKSGVSRLAGEPIWQKSFYDHIIRNEESYLEIWRYIDENPLKWREDELYTM